MANTTEEQWQRPSDLVNARRDDTSVNADFAVPRHALWAGISVKAALEVHSADVAIAIHDGIYLQDFFAKCISVNKHKPHLDPIADHVMGQLKVYERENHAKFVGVGIPVGLRDESPTLLSRLWLDLDIVPISIPVNIIAWPDRAGAKTYSYWESKGVDEQADSMARKCIMHFGPKLSPLLQVNYKGAVEVDCDSRAHMLTPSDYQRTCSPETWEAMMKFAQSLKKSNKKIAFFSSTPQGGGVALMRHALVRIAHNLGVDLQWYVPKPKPGIFRTTKIIHNTLQGIAKPNEKVDVKEKLALNEWIGENANRYWLIDGGPLLPSSEGGADIIVVDDPQMPRLISIVKDLTPEKPVIFRSHIQIRSDLVDQEGTPQANIWHFLWQNIKRADVFISHPIPSFVPKNVPDTKVAYMPATTDWLDGLNKPLTKSDIGYYLNLYNKECSSSSMTKLTSANYIIQIARFDPAKGIDDVLRSYAEFTLLLSKNKPNIEIPQLVVTGNSSVDDPEGSKIYDETINEIRNHYPHLESSISVMRLNCNDQLLNSLLSAAHVVLQLSTREGFEVKVSEAIHKGIPVIATRAGGIPLQVRDKENGFLVEPGDWKATADHLYELWTNDQLYKNMGEFAKTSVSDEVGTVGNALSWFYLADKLGRGEKVKITPGHKWVNDLARDAAGKPYEKGCCRLPRSV